MSDILLHRRRMMMQQGGGLPAEYQQVEWLLGGTLTGGRAYILIVPFDLYGYHLENKYIFEAEVYVTNASSRSFFYVLDTGQTFNCFWRASANQIGIKLAGGSTERYFNKTGILPVGDHIVNVDTTTSPCSLNIDGNTTLSNGGFTTTGRQTFQLPRANSASVYRYKKFSIIDNIHKDHVFIPCYRKQDGKTGFYDIKWNVFIPNSGTVEFQKGADV